MRACELSLCPAAVRLLTDARHLRRSCSSWPACGGANGSIRFEPEINHGANAGLSKGEPPPPTHPHPTAPFLRARNYIYDCTDVIHNARGSGSPASRSPR